MLAYQWRRDEDRAALLAEIAAKVPGEIGVLAQVMILYA